MKFKRLVLIISATTVLCLIANPALADTGDSPATPATASARATTVHIRSDSVRLKLVRHGRKLTVTGRVLAHCQGHRDYWSELAWFSDLRLDRNGRFRAQNHRDGDLYASAEDITGRIKGRSVTGRVRWIDSDHGLGSGPGGNDCSTGKRPTSPPPKSWLRFHKGKSFHRGHKPHGATCAGLKADYVGTNRADRIKARPGSVVVARGGNDRISGRNLKVCAGPGNDRITIIGASGSVYGGPGNDIIKGGPGWDVLYGGKGDDRTQGGEGADTIYGGPGDDRLDGGDGTNWIFGGPGSDRISGGGVVFG